MTINLPGCNRDVDIRGMSTGEMDLLTNPAHVKSGRALRTIVKKCLLTPDIQLENLLYGDFIVLTIAVRRATYGDECDFIAQCSFCKHGGTYTVDLSQLPARQGDRELVERQLQDPEACHAYTFPECGRTARFRLEQGEQQPVTPKQLRVETLQRRIVAVDGLKESGTPLRVFLRDELPGGDTSDFLRYYDQVSPGIDDEVRVNCTGCGVEFQCNMSPGLESFFDRSKQKTSGEPNSTLRARPVSPSESTCLGPSATA
ncbi:MAG: hypothetical protein AAF471_05110 [Myxococcota bacterium]